MLNSILKTNQNIQSRHFAGKNTCKIFFLLTAYHLWLITPSSAQNYRWAHGFGANFADSHGTDIATDANANVYVTGFCGDTIDFDPSLTGIAKVSPGGYIAKYDSAGAYLWAISIAYSSYGNIRLAVNATGVYVTGCFAGTFDFDPSAAAATLTANHADIYLAKYDLSGNYVWAKNMGGSIDDASNSIAIDNLGNSYITGYFKDTADFDPGVSSAILISNGILDAFFAKYDPFGNLLWAYDITDNSLRASGSKVAIDNITSEVYLVGYFEGVVDFDRGAGVHNLTSQGGLNNYVLKLDSGGNFIWVGSISTIAITDILINNSNIYLCGGFGGNVDFDLTSGSNMLSTGSLFNGDKFFAKYDPNGNNIFIKHFQYPTASESFRTINITAFNKIFLTCVYRDSTSFDTISGSNNVYSNGGSDIAFTQYDNNGNLVWAKSIGGLYSDMSNSVALDLLGNIYLTGYFTNSMDADPGPGSAILSPSTAENIFIAKYDNTLTNLPNNQSATKDSLQLYPNPASDYITVLPQSISTLNNQFSIIDVNGKELIKGVLTESSKINVSALADGVYVLKVKTPTNVSYQKFVKAITGLKKPY